MLQFVSSKKFFKSSGSIGVLILCAFFVSGSAGLIHEVVWSRLLRHVMGNTVYSITTVLCAFMGGLALGSYAGGRIIDRRSDPLRVFAVLEGVIALYCLALPFLINGIEPVYKFFYQYTHANFYIFSLIRFFFSGLILLIPATFMGASLPVLTRFFAQSSNRIGWSVGTVYGINTFGAVLGAFISGFILIPNIGVTKSIFVACLLNALAAGSAFLLYRLIKGQSLAIPVQDKTPEYDLQDSKNNRKDNRWKKFFNKISKGKSSYEPYVPHTGKAVLLVLIGYGLAGFASLVYEIAWTRVISMMIGSSTYAFSMMLTAFILGLAIGSMVCAKFADRVRDPLRTLAVIELVIGVSALAFIPVIGALPFFVTSMISRFMGSFWQLLIAEFFIIFLLMLIPTIFMGAAFPVANRVLSLKRETIGRTVGNVYGANTIGTIFGSFIGGFVFIPFLGIQNSIFIAGAINIITALLFWNMHRKYRLSKRVMTAGVTTVAMIVIIAVIPKWNSQDMSFGPFYAASLLDKNEAQSSDLMREFAESMKILFYKEGVDTTVAVKQDSEGTISLSVNGKPDASTGMTDMLNQKISAHIPAMLHPDPHNALVLGLASGITLGSLGLYPLDSIDCLEISPVMIEASSYFSDYNRNILKDPRVNLIIADGRNHLALTNKKYDIIISEPSNPWIAGVADLFTKEFFELCRNRLTSQGVICAWLHFYNMDVKTFNSIVYTFTKVFPNSTIWKSAYGDSLLIGSPGNISVDYNNLLKRMAIPAVASDLKSINIDSVNSFLGKLIMGPAGMQQLSKGALLHTDDNALVEFAAPRAMAGEVFQPDLIRDLRQNWEANLSFLTSQPADSEKLKASKKILNNYIQARKHLFYADFSYTWGEVEEGSNELTNALAMRAPAEVFIEFTSELYTHAVDFAKTGHKKQAMQIIKALVTQYTEIVNRNPNNSNARNMFAEFLYRDSRAGEALQQYRILLQQNPKHALVMNNIATILLNKEHAYFNPSEAMRLAKNACDLTGNNNALFLYTLSISYGALGRIPEAKKTAYEALLLARNTGNKHMVNLIESRIRGY